MFEIEMLPASFGDCLLVRYGDADAPHSVLIDGGVEQTSTALADRLREIGKPAQLDLLVVTHIDADHIGGIVRLMETSANVLEPADVWFNGRAQIEQVYLGALQGERLSERIEALRWPWNRAFEGKAIFVPDEGELPTRTLAGGATLTLLSPRAEHLADLARAWRKTIARAGIGHGTLGDETETERREEECEGDAIDDRDRLGIDVGRLARTPFVEDRAIANGSSIAFLFEWDGRRVVFGADAFPTVLADSLDRLPSPRRPITAFKLPHHGSRANVDRRLIETAPCSKYLVSTDGKRFGHPSDEAIARLIRYGSRPDLTIFFNYVSERNRRWSDRTLCRDEDYRAAYPSGGEGIVVSI